MKGATGKEKKKVKFSAEVTKEGQRSTLRCFWGMTGRSQSRVW
jgi:hypothetical protein